MAPLLEDCGILSVSWDPDLLLVDVERVVGRREMQSHLEFGKADTLTEMIPG